MAAVAAYALTEQQIHGSPVGKQEATQCHVLALLRTKKTKELASSGA